MFQKPEMVFKKDLPLLIDLECTRCGRLCAKSNIVRENHQYLCPRCSGRGNNPIFLGKEVNHMAEPSKKDPGMETLIDSTNPSGRKRVDSIEKDICTWYGEPVTEFRDELSRKEYTISGFCQTCQDKTFGR